MLTRPGKVCRSNPPPGCRMASWRSTGWITAAGGVINARRLDSCAHHLGQFRRFGNLARAEQVLELAGLTPRSTPAERKPALEALLAQKPVETLAGELGCGVPTLQDILEQLNRPGRDPRADTPTPILRSDMLSMDDLTANMILKGTVRNVVDFGAFVDIGVKQDGLLHLKSQNSP